jgi:hypothetical protein
MLSRKQIPVSVVIAMMLLTVAAAQACNVPVFRYALERWRPDAYEAIIFHKGPLSAEEQKLVAELKKAAEDSKTPANLEVITVDLAGDVAAPVKQVWEANASLPLKALRVLGASASSIEDVQARATLPWLVLRYPASVGLETAAWTGPPTQESVQALLHSPARREIAKRLLKGESGVFVLIESGDKKQDDATAALVQAELKKMEKAIELPDQDAKPEDGQAPVKLLADVPLRVSFSVLRVSRSDPAEKLLLSMLLNLDDEIARMQDKPLLFPMFGRGRTLEPCAGKGINDENIESGARFLCSACSCTVKRLSPGADVLIAANWESIIEGGATPPEPPSKPGVPVPIPKTVEVVAPSVSVATVVAEGAVAELPERSSLSRYMWLGIIGLALVAAVTGSVALKSRKNGNC